MKHRVANSESKQTAPPQRAPARLRLDVPWHSQLALDERSTQVLLLWGSLCLAQRRPRGTIAEAVSRSRDDLRSAEWMARWTSGHQERKARRSSACDAQGSSAQHPRPGLCEP